MSVNPVEYVNEVASRSIANLCEPLDVNHNYSPHSHFEKPECKCLGEKWGSQAIKCVDPVAPNTQLKSAKNLSAEKKVCFLVAVRPRWHDFVGLSD